MFAVTQHLFLAGFAALWAASCLWAHRDACRRYDDDRRPRRALAAALVLPFAGVLLYLCARRAETREERRERELFEMLVARAGERCLVCRTPVEPSFLCCPACGTGLRRRCPGCGEPLELAWSVCPYCESKLAPPVRRVA